jgi:hypothetical protein
MAIFMIGTSKTFLLQEHCDVEREQIPFVDIFLSLVSAWVMQLLFDCNLPSGHLAPPLSMLMMQSSCQGAQSFFPANCGLYTQLQSLYLNV